MRGKRLIIAFYLILSTALVSGIVPELNRPGKVLVLHSYHTGYSWTDDMNTAITEILHDSREAALKPDLFVEYMDTQRSFSGNTFDLLEAVYRDRYTERGVRFDVIIATDDPALNFLQDRGDRLFGEVPVVFCGINDLELSRLRGRENYTGVNEAIDIPQTIELALKLRPEAETIAVVSDATYTGRINTGIYRSVRSRFDDRVEFLELLELAPEEVRHGLGRLEPTDLALVLSYVVTPDGQRLTVEQGFSFLAEASPAPVFSFWDFTLGTGVVGGVLVSAREQGATAARMARRILSGHPVADIPVVMDSPNRTMMDYQAMRTHGIAPRDLPEGAILVNRPERPLRTYWIWTLALLVFVLLQGILIVTLLSARRRRKRVQKELETLTANSPDIIMRVDTVGRLLYVNGAVERLLREAPESLRGRSLRQISGTAEKIAGWMDAFDQVLRDGVPRTVTFLAELEPEATMTLESRLIPEFDDHDRLRSVLIITRDITEEARTRSELARSLEEQEVLLREIHHRVKNNLQVVASLINISILGRDDVEDALREVQQRVVAMAQIHEQLYQSGNYADINLGSYLRDVVSHVVTAYQNVGRPPEVLLQADAVTVHLDVAVPFGLILTELVTNALKHGFRGAERSPSGRAIISVDLLERSNAVTLRVTDNGPGTPPDFVLSEATSTGLTLVRSLVQQIRGSISVTDRDGVSGTIFEVVFPRL
ncbi:MAG: PAS domain S-box protein [Spirochaetaceae bacterium]|nr:MAG: PAS domain S-box protein [Spirochaetaceae bacterium]